MSVDSVKVRYRQYNSGKDNRQPKRKKHLQKWMHILLWIILSGLIFFCLMFIVWYISVANKLPDVGELREKASQFETTRLLDRDGNLLYEINDPNAGRRDYVSLDDISPYLLAAVIATEDKDFFSHPGFDLSAIFRSAIQNFSSGKTVAGGSTITQQLARNLLLTPDERYQRTISRKVKEVILSVEISRRYSKEDILELYLNENYYGNHSYGVEAASQSYFGVSAKYLTLGQSAFIAGLPQAPGYYDVFSNREVVIARQQDVLTLMYRLSSERGCIRIDLSSGEQYPVCVDMLMIDQAAEEIEMYDFEQIQFQMRYPHWVYYVWSQLESEFGTQNIYRSGYTIYTTIDPELQETGERILAEQVSQMQANNAKNGALIALNPETGEILSMVGSTNFYSNDNSNQINMAVAERQPGSAIKPLIYAAAFEKGWTPATLIWDVPTKFSPDGKDDGTQVNDNYEPVNYDGKFHGPVLVRNALGNSYNIPAVKTLEYVGIYDDPATALEDGFIPFAKRFHMNSLDKPAYGLSVALGGGEVTLLELTAAYTVFANNGCYIKPRSILRILDHDGNQIYQAEPPLKEKVLNPEYAWQITSILSDNSARADAFGADSILNLSFPTAVKTGTTNDFRDNWTIGYTPKLAVGVWIGNADYTPMFNTTGVSGAAPVWAAFMNKAAVIDPDIRFSSFPKPDGIAEMTICDISGTIPSESCPKRRTEYFAYYQPPLSAEHDLWKQVRIDSWTGKLANAFCSDTVENLLSLNVTDPWAVKWLNETEQGRSWAETYGFIGKDGKVLFTPAESCTQNDQRPTLTFSNLTDGMTISEDSLDIYGIVNSASKSDQWSLEFGLGDNPTEWFVIVNNQFQFSSVPNYLGTWHTAGLDSGPYTLRIYCSSLNGDVIDKRIHIHLTRNGSEQNSREYYYDTDTKRIEYWEEVPDP